ncbi:MAG: hypothetical protein R3A51_04665 [Nannocystaceae bacterium]
MNFFGHATVARWFVDSPAYVLGAMLPDFASMAGVRIAGVDDAELADGVALHHRTDDVFHRAPIFCALMGEAQDVLEDRGLERGSAMAVAHVGVELLLDGWLSAREEGALASYRAALEVPDPAVRWRTADAEQRWPTLRDRLRASALPGAYRDPAFVADRLVMILARRPRLAVDDRGAAVIAGWASAGVDAVAARGEALMAWLRQELLEAPKGAGAEP